MASAAQKRTDFLWDARRTRAAELLAADELSDEAIAQECGRSRRWLSDCKLAPAFMERVGEIRARLAQAIAEKLEAESLGRRENRIRALDEDFRRTQRIVDERGADPAEWADAPGYRSGLLTHTVKSVRAGSVYKAHTAGVNGIVLKDEDGEPIAMLDGADSPEFEIHHVYEFDAALVRERREISKQIAQDLGQWSDKSEIDYREHPFMQAQRELYAFMNADDEDEDDASLGSED